MKRWTSTGTSTASAATFVCRPSCAAGGLRLGQSSMVPVAAPPTTNLEAHLTGSYDALLDAFMPPSVLVTEARQVIQTFGGASATCDSRAAASRRTCSTWWTPNCTWP